MSTEDEFTTFIYHKVIPFCLPRSYVRECWEKLKKTGHERYFFEPTDRARKLFIKAREKNAKSGEPGEVVLFTLLEGLLNAPRIVAKMSLKTNPNMEIHGSDAIHMKYDPGTETLNIYWGEAKLYKELSSALSQIMESIKGFREYNDQTTGVQRDFDISIIQAHPDIDTPDNKATAEALLSYFDPYSPYSNKIREIHACLAMWDWSFYKELTTVNPEKAEALFREKYLERIETACSLFITNIKKQNLNRYRFQFFLIPLPDVRAFRKQFCQKMGLPFKEEDDKDK